MFALWSVVWSFSFHQVSVCTVAGCWYCWYWCLVLCWRDQPHLLQLCLVHSWHATLEILNDVFYRQLPHILKYISSVGEIFGDGVWYYLLYSCSRVQCAPNLLLVPVSILSIHFIFRISCFALLFLFSFSLILCSCHRYTNAFLVILACIPLFCILTCEQLFAFPCPWCRLSTSPTSRMDSLSLILTCYLNTTGCCFVVLPLCYIAASFGHRVPFFHLYFLGSL
jgi:hypothetical protein